MLLSGSSYLTRDVYRPLVETVDERREAILARVGVAVFALGSFGASLFQPATLIEIGDTAFGGFAQLSLPVLIALYWTRTTRAGIAAGIVGSQLFYLASVFAPFLPLIAGSYFGGWSASVVGMALGAVLTVAVSLVTSAGLGEDATLYRTTGAETD